MKSPKHTLLSGLFILSLSPIFAQWSGAGPDQYHTGRVGIGTTYIPNATGQWYGTTTGPFFESSSTNVLPGYFLGTSLISSFSGNSSDQVRLNTWLVNTGGMLGWQYTNVHDGLSYNALNRTPRTDTRTWWERNPFGDRQSWGTAAQAYMILAPFKLCVINNTTGTNMQTYISTDPTLGHIGVTTSGVDHALMNLNYSSVNNAPQVWIGALKPQGTNSDFNFAVQGKIVGQSVYVTATGSSNWADYVFANDYKLPKLEEVERFYKLNKHLSEIPSAVEVAEKGINVGELNTVLVKKIEELTLYMVDLNKKVEALQRENEKLKNK